MPLIIIEDSCPITYPDLNYPSPDNPPPHLCDPQKRDELGRRIAQPPAGTPATTFVRLDFDVKVRLEEHAEWEQTLVQISREAGWAATHVGKVVGQPHNVVLVVQWEDEAPVAMRNNHVPAEPSVFSFAGIRHLLSSDPSLLVVGHMPPGAFGEHEVVIIRGPPSALSGKILFGAFMLQMHSREEDHPELFSAKGIWSLNDDPGGERGIVVSFGWKSREEEAEYKSRNSASTTDDISPYAEYVVRELRDMREKGAHVEQIDVDYEQWWPEQPGRTLPKILWCNCCIQ